MAKIIMTRAEYRTLPKDKVSFYRAARKDSREAQKRAGVARLPAKRAARAAHYNALCIMQKISFAHLNAAIETRHYSRQYFEIITRWEWNPLHLWIPKEVQ